MTTEEALQHYNSVANSIFSAKNKKRGTQEGTFKASTLEAEMRRVISGSFPGYTGDELMLEGAGEHETGNV